MKRLLLSAIIAFLPSCSSGIPAGTYSVTKGDANLSITVPPHPSK